MTDSPKPGPLQPPHVDHWAEVLRLTPAVQERLGAHSSAVLEWVYHLTEALRPFLDTHASHARKP